MKAELSKIKLTKQAVINDKRKPVEKISEKNQDTVAPKEVADAPVEVSVAADVDIDTEQFDKAPGQKSKSGNAAQTPAPAPEPEPEPEIILGLEPATAPAPTPESIPAPETKPAPKQESKPATEPASTTQKSSQKTEVDDAKRQKIFNNIMNNPYLSEERKLEELGKTGYEYTDLLAAYNKAKAKPESPVEDEPVAPTPAKQEAATNSSRATTRGTSETAPKDEAAQQKTDAPVEKPSSEPTNSKKPTEAPVSEPTSKPTTAPAAASTSTTTPAPAPTSKPESATTTPATQNQEVTTDPSRATTRGGGAEPDTLPNQPKPDTPAEVVPEMNVPGADEHVTNNPETNNTVNNQNTEKPENFVQDKIDDAVDGVKEYLGDLKGRLTEAIKSLTGDVGSTVFDIKNYIDNPTGGVNDVIGGLVKNVVGFITNPIGSLGKLASGPLVGLAKDLLGGLLDKVNNFLFGAEGDRTWLGKVVDGVKDWVGEVVNKVSNFLFGDEFDRTWLGDAVDWVKEKYAAANEWVGGIIDTVKNFLFGDENNRKLLGKVVDAVNDGINAVKEWALGTEDNPTWLGRLFGYGKKGNDDIKADDEFNPKDELDKDQQKIYDGIMKSGMSPEDKARVLKEQLGIDVVIQDGKVYKANMFNNTNETIDADKANDEFDPSKLGERQQQIYEMIMNGEGTPEEKAFALKEQLNIDVVIKDGKVYVVNNNNGTDGNVSLFNSQEEKVAYYNKLLNSDMTAEEIDAELKRVGIDYEKDIKTYVGDYNHDATEYEIVHDKQTHEDVFNEYQIINGQQVKTATTYRDANGNIIQEERDEYDANGKRIGTTLYSYDAKGNLLHSMETKYDENGQKVSISDCRTTYDANGNVTGSVSIDTQYKDGKVSAENKIEYDNNGNIKARAITSNTYDKQGNLKNSSVTEFLGDSNVPSAVYQKAKDSQGNWITVKIDAKTGKQLERKVVDTNGNTYDFAIGENGSLELVSAHDKNGNDITDKYVAELTQAEERKEKLDNISNKLLSGGYGSGSSFRREDFIQDWIAAGGTQISFTGEDAQAIVYSLQRGYSLDTVMNDLDGAKRRYQQHKNNQAYGGGTGSGYQNTTGNSFYNSGANGWAPGASGSGQVWQDGNSDPYHFNNWTYAPGMTGSLSGAMTSPSGGGGGGGVGRY